MDLPRIRRIIESNKKFVLTTHVNPDGDGLGSELALYRVLKKLGKEATILNHSATPRNYEFLDLNAEIVKFDPERDRETVLSADVIFIVDTNQPDRLRTLQPFVLKSKGIKICIDHHLDTDDFADHYLIDEHSSASGEIVYRLIVELGSSYIDADVARALYTAIMTDTGSFRFPRTDPEIHRIAAHLIERGADPTEIYQKVYESWPPGRFLLLGRALSGMKLEHEGRLAYLVITRSMLEETSTNPEDTDNFTNYPMSIGGVLIGIMFTELRDGVKISFRSKGEIPINELAKAFGGNGHKNAAGARIFEKTLQEIVPAVVEKSSGFLTQVNDKPGS